MKGVGERKRDRDKENGCGGGVRERKGDDDRESGWGRRKRDEDIDMSVPHSPSHRLWSIVTTNNCLLLAT